MGLLRLHLFLTRLVKTLGQGRMSSFLLMVVFNTPQAVHIGFPGLQLAVIVLWFRILAEEHHGHIWVLFNLIIDLILLFDRFVDVIEDLIGAKASSISYSSFELC